MPAKKSPPPKKLALVVTLIERRIYLIRGQKVMIDSDLAELYGVETKILNRVVRRNLERFPEDFMFQLTKDKEESLRIQFGTLEPAGRGQHRKYLPYVFTEQRVAMLSSVLNSKRAIEVHSDHAGLCEATADARIKRATQPQVCCRHQKTGRA
jgi:hypothetical protein